MIIDPDGNEIEKENIMDSRNTTGLVSNCNIISSYIKICKEICTGSISKDAFLISKKMMQIMPIDESEFMDLCNVLLSYKHGDAIFCTSFMFKERANYLTINNFHYFQSWLFEYVDSWGKCDSYCYRVLNPLLEKHPELFSSVKEWATNNSLFVRRASAVCLIRSSQKLIVYLPFEYVKEICDILKYNQDETIKKAVGWVLKCCYFNYSKSLEKYLEDNSNSLSRISYRYALEHMDVSKRNYFLKLKK